MDNNDLKNKRVVLFVNLHKNNSSAIAAEIQMTLEKRGIQVTQLCFEGRPEVPVRGDWDIVFSLGGDGTVLYTARTVSPWGLPILPVNLGTLGFIAGVQKEKWLHVFEQWISGEAEISERCMLELFVQRHGARAAYFNFLNDAVVSASGIAKLINLNVLSYINGSNFFELGPYRCDGLIVATATGSTGYSMAAGGPILDSEMDAMILTPICPFTLSNRPLVLHVRQTLEIIVTREQRSGVLLTVDGQDIYNLEPDDRVVIRQAPYKAILVSTGHDAYYSALRTKLNWPMNDGGGINA